MVLSAHGRTDSMLGKRLQKSVEGIRVLMKQKIEMRENSDTFVKYKNRLLFLQLKNMMDEKYLYIYI